jgi:bifunctional non-homologous end joining protein LigD
MPLLRAPAAFDHPEWLFELKHDGFRALAIIEGPRCRLVSRNGHVYGQWPQLAEELAHAVRAHHAVLDGEAVCLKRDGRSDFEALLFQREWPYFYAFDLLSVEGRDLRRLSLTTRKRELRRVMPRPEVESRIRYVDHLAGRGSDLFRLVCRRDCEGIVAKWKRGTYHTDGVTTSWLKVKNPGYSQAQGRHDLFTRRLDPAAASAQAIRPRAGR